MSFDIIVMELQPEGLKAVPPIHAPRLLAHEVVHNTSHSHSSGSIHLGSNHLAFLKDELITPCNKDTASSAAHQS